MKSPYTPFLIGFLTPLLPCGQSLLLFAFSAMLGNVFEGLLQGALFSLLTTPSLFLAIQGSHFLKKYKKIADPLLLTSVVVVGVLTTLRGLAELEVIPHYTLLSRLHLTLW